MSDRPSIHQTEERPTITIGGDGNPDTVDFPGDDPPASDHEEDKCDDVGEPVAEKVAQVKRVGRCATFTNLINALIGAGIVGVPATFKYCGVGPTIILLLLSCVLCYTCGNIIVGLQWDLEVKGLDELATVMFGKPGKIIIAILCIIFSLSCCSSYLIIATGKLVDWLSLTKLNMEGTWPWAITCLVYSLCIPVALTIPRHLTFISRLSMLSTFCVLFYAIALLVKASLFIHTDGFSPTAIGYQAGLDLFTAFSVHALTFSLPIVMMPVIAPYNPNKRKRRLVLGWVYMFSWVMVAIPGMMAYLMKGADTASDVLSSFDKSDILIIIVQAAIFINVTLGYPLVLASMVGSLGELIWKQNLAELMTIKQRLILIPIVNAVNILIGMFLKNIQAVLGVGGALGGCIVVFAFPSMCRLKQHKEPYSSPRSIGHFILVIFGLFAAAVCTYFSIASAIKSF